PVLRQVRQGPPPRDLAISPDGALLYLLIDLGADDNGLMRRINTNSDPFVIEGADLKVGVSPNAIALTPDGKLAVVTNSGSDAVSIIDTATNAVVDSVAVDPSPIDVAISSDGLRAYVLRDRDPKHISVIDLDRRTVMRR